MSKASRRQSRQASSLGGHERVIPHYTRGQQSHEPVQCFITLTLARAKRDSGLGEFINRGKAFRSFDKVTPLTAPHDFGGRSTAQSRKIAEPSPRPGWTHRLDKNGDAHVPMGMMTRYVADQNAGRRGTAVQLAVESWAPKDRRHEYLKRARSKHHGNAEPGAD